LTVDNQQEPKGPGQAEAGAQENGEKTASPVVPSNLPVSASSPTDGKTDSLATKNYELSRRQFVIALITLVALATYTSIAAYQANLMREATNASRRSAAAAESAAQTAEDTFNQNKDFANKTLGEIQKQTTAMQDSSDAAKSQADTSKRASKLSEDTLVENRKAFQLQIVNDRPYMTPQNIYFAAPFSTVADNEIIVEVENTGNTVALGVQSKINMFFSPYGEMNEFHIMTNGQDFDAYDVPAHSVQIWKMPIDKGAFEEGDMESILRHRKIIYIAGVMTYTDSAREDLRLNVCAYFAPEDGPHFRKCRSGFRIIEDTQSKENKQPQRKPN